MSYGRHASPSELSMHSDAAQSNIGSQVQSNTGELGDSALRRRARISAAHVHRASDYIKLVPFKPEIFGGFNVSYLHPPTAHLPMYAQNTAQSNKH